MESLKNFLLLAKYNLKIVFGGKFIWFLIVAVLLFLLFMFLTAYNGQEPSESIIYSQMLLPAVLVIFYPTVYGLSSDEENKTLEILFSIPNYMYKVWLVRFLFVMIQSVFIIFMLSVLSYFLLYPISIFEMTYHVIYPVLFAGSLAFFLSTMVKGGNGTAVVFIVAIIIIILMGSSFSTSMWNVLINPYKESNKIHPTVWMETITNNRLFLSVTSAGLIMLSLRNLQKRERILS